MKHFLPLLLLVLTICTGTNAQNTLIKGTKIEKNKLYLKLEGGEFRTFVDRDNEAGDESIGEKKKFAMTSNECNIYVRWLNPLHYQIKWADSTFEDEADLAVQSFVTKLVEMFGAPVANLNKNNAESAAAIAKSGLGAPGTGVGDLHYPPTGFKNAELTFLYLSLRQLAVSIPLTADDIKNINSIESDLNTLDKLIATNIAEGVEAEFKKLYAIKTAQQLATDLPDIKKNISEFEELTFKPAEDAAKALSTALSNIESITILQSI
ncbi:hypothetical protein [Chitinophaga rhizosphaerae]|uniref:hypothetical protein n=1 Tax=Chitinophaga rhizosphaerae TaxID=1864947 RepID=UPI000F80C3F4|nr:hypothetical protein [Chitinophaga rhizosphaerae]